MSKQLNVQRIFASNVAFSVFSRSLYLGTRLFIPPMVLAHVSLAEYGIWAVCFILVGYIGTAAFGLSNSYVKHVAERHGQGDLSGVSALFSTGIALTTGFSLLALPAIWFGAPWLAIAFGVPEALHETARLMFFGTAAVFLLDMSLGGFAYLLHGLQRSRLADQVWIASYLIEFALLIAFMQAGLGIYALLYAFALRYVFSTAAYAVLAWRLVPGLRVSPRLFDRASLRFFLGYGGLSQLSGILSTVLRSLEKALAGSVLGVEAAALFDIGVKFPSMMQAIPSSFAYATFPAAAYLHSQGRHAEILRLYLTSSRHLNLLAGVVMGFLAAFAMPLLSAWLGNVSFLGQAAWLLLLFSLPYQLEVFTAPGTAVQSGMGRADRALAYPGAQAGAALLLVPAWLAFGADPFEAIAYSVSLSMSAGALVFLYASNRWMGVSQWQFARIALLPGLLPYLVGFAIAAAWGDSTCASCGRVDRVLSLFPLGMAYLVACSALIYAIVLDSAERASVRALAGRLATLASRISGRTIPATDPA